MNAGAVRRAFVVRGRDFSGGGRASTAIKDLLKAMGVPPDIVRRVAIAAYEAEMNVVLYADRGLLTVDVTPARVVVTCDDRGPGIADVGLAMQEGWSTATPEMREMGFGAGMGLPNIARNSDRFEIRSEVGRGTRLVIEVALPGGP
jgi:anti-sigma regulatory factor (Ser/Thr protein kinase)